MPSESRQRVNRVANAQNKNKNKSKNKQTKKSTWLCASARECVPLKALFYTLKEIVHAIMGSQILEVDNK